MSKESYLEENSGDSANEDSFEETRKELTKVKEGCKRMKYMGAPHPFYGFIDLDLNDTLDNIKEKIVNDVRERHKGKVWSFLEVGDFEPQKLSQRHNFNIKSVESLFFKTPTTVEEVKARQNKGFYDESMVFINSNAFYSALVKRKEENSENNSNNFGGFKQGFLN